MYILLDTYKDCELWQTRHLDREDAPWQTKEQLSLSQPESGHESWRGSIPRRTDGRTDWLTDWLTDRQLQSDFDSDSERCPVTTNINYRVQQKNRWL
jgi:hypothetical protein